MIISRYYIAIIFGIFFSTIFIQYIPIYISLMFLILLTFIALILGAYLSKKYDIPVGDFMGHPFETEKKYEKYRLGRVFISLFYFVLGIYVGFIFLYIFKIFPFY